jgi:Flp pilus assembly protein CpaB
MKAFKMKALLVALLTILALAQTTAMAAESKPKYKKTTGQVVSVNQNEIVIKGRSKQPLTLALNAGTEVIGAKTAKAGDTAAVNYRVDKNGKTATRIKVLPPAAEKPASAPSAASPAVQKTN